MCGIAGMLGSLPADSERVLWMMGNSLRHRGPDGEGAWLDPDAGVGFAHRRLAVLDLSEAGRQPMCSRSGRFVLTFNGEIYNHVELRLELAAAGHGEWRGYSDTEVLLTALEHWGPEAALQRCNGMFALALWDREAGELLLARDRTGEKPLYVGWVHGSIVFGSELRALRCHPGWRHAVEPVALELMLRLGYVPAPWSIHPGIFKLPAASVLRLRAADAAQPLSAEEFHARLGCYWSLDEVVAAGLNAPWSGSEGEALHALQGLLDDAVRQRMVADVPVGALLSGGVDSSLVVASMQRQSATRVRTFTIGFDEQELDESEPARQVARMLGTEHEEVRLPAGRALELIEPLADIYDEPFADAAQLPSLLICQAARQRVTIALTGDGGDELFHGYQRYMDADRIWGVLGHVPAAIRRAAAETAQALAQTIGRGPRAATLRRQAGRIGARDADDYYARMLAFPGAIPVLGNGWSRGAALAWPHPPRSLVGLAPRMRYVDQRLGLPEGIHAKLDRASMSVALELRVPLLDHRLLAMAWCMPQRWLAHGGVGKLLLRGLLGRQLPVAVTARRKQGFDVPVSAWLRGPLRGWAEDLLNAKVLAQDPLIDGIAARARFAEHLAGRADHGYALWALLMYRSWSECHG